MPSSRRVGFVCRIGLVSTLLLLSGSAWGAKPAPRTPAETVASELEAGEFGPAIKTAQSVADSAQRVKLLEQITQAQRASGEHAAARETAGLIPQPRERAHDRSVTAREQSWQGGGSTRANFQPLITLITTTISPDTWEDNGGDGRMGQFATGVHVDPHGQLRIASREELTDRLTTLQSRARDANLGTEMSRQSSLRLISLPRLERAVTERIASGQSVPESMRRLAGLSRIQYVLILPETHDVILAGPAEGWKYAAGGRAVGRESGRLTLELDDLVVLLRTFGQKGQNDFGCSINTRDANLKSLKDYVEQSQAKGPLKPGQLTPWLNEMHKRLGLQDVVVTGVPATSRVAQVLVEADYRMKLIGIAKLDGGPHVPSYFAILPRLGNTQGGALDALRWWLTMKYSAIDHSPDRSTFEIQGSSVLCQSEHQFVTTQGAHQATGATEPANALFAQNFTQHYAELSKKEPVFADLQNIFDLAMAVTICQEEGLYELADWTPQAFAAGGLYHPAELQVPTAVDSVINHRVYNGKNIVVQVAGGVEANIRGAVRDKHLQHADEHLSTVQQKSKTPTVVPADRWWWDAGK